MSCKKCSNKLILSEYIVFLLNFLCFVVHIELVSYLNHSRNTFASLYVNYIVPPHSGLESAISITFIYLFIIDDKLVCLLNAFQISIQMLQLQRFITCLIINKYDLKFIAICHQFIVA